MAASKQYLTRKAHLSDIIIKKINKDGMTEQDNERTTSTEPLNDDYDSPWKDAVEHYFPEFMAFYFPDAYDCFDWNLGYSFLEQELRSVIHDAALGKRFVDKLAQLRHKNGDESWIYVHIEVQASKDNDFAKRMFTYLKFPSF